MRQQLQNVLPAVGRRAAYGILAAAALALTACATQRPDATSGATAASRTCIPVAELSEWEPFDELSVIFSTPGSSHGYLLRLARPISGLMTAGDIDVVDTDLDGFICPAGADALYVVDCDGARVKIASIYPLERGRPSEVL